MTKTCNGCGLPEGEVKLSKRGYCPECAGERMLDALDGMINKRGPYYERWKVSMRLFYERELKESS